MTVSLTADPTMMLKSAGLRVTAPRVPVLRTLVAHPHATADVLVGRVRAELGAVSTQAVYDILHAFTAAGLARRIEPSGSPALFEVRVGDNHHLICRSCGLIVDVDCAVGDAPCLTQSQQPAGFVVDEAEVVYWGYCPSCNDPIGPAARSTDIPSSATDRAFVPDKESTHGN
jgi:Fur family transcriptional regulator, stress-responsive regulator